MTSSPFLASRRCVTVVIALLAIGSCYLSMSSASAAETSEQAVLAAHEQRRTATIQGDADAVGAMMTEDLTFTHANGVMESKAQFLDAVETGRLDYQTLADEELQVRVYGDTGIVSGTVRIVVDASGTEIDIRVLFTELWVKKGAAWKMVLWHATNASSPDIFTTITPITGRN